MLTEVGFPAFPLLCLFESIRPPAGSASAAGGCGLLEDPGLVGT